MKTLKIALAGNPNAGKSMIFNALTGAYTDVSNYPGTTVDIFKGKFKNNILIDTPGIYGVSSFNDEEKAAHDIIVESDIVINVVNSLYLERDLFLTQQLIDMNKKVIVCLNMIDEIKKKNMYINTKKLSEFLNVPVVESSALKSIGITELKNSIDKACLGNKTPKIDRYTDKFVNLTKNLTEALLIAEDDSIILGKYSLKEGNSRYEIYRMRRRRVERIAEQVLDYGKTKQGISSKISYSLLKPKIGFPVFFLVITLMFWFIGVITAQYIVDFTEKRIMAEWYQPFIIDVLYRVYPPDGFLKDLFIGDFGLLTMVPTYIFGILLPLIASFYFILSILEDSGYLPRIAVLLDKSLNKIGLSGRAVIPLVLGLGCVTAATISTRLLSTRREKFIATALLGLCIPCSAQTGMIAAKIVPLGFPYIALYILIVSLVFILSGTALNKLDKGKTGYLLIDLPPLRIPQGRNVLKKTFSKTVQFISEAIPIFAIGAIAVTILIYTGFIERISLLAAPVVTGILKLPKEASTAFLMAILRRDFGIAGLDTLVLTPKQTLTAMITLTLFVPCIAAVLTIFKERSKFEALLIWVLSFAVAIFVGGLTAWLL